MVSKFRFDLGAGPLRALSLTQPWATLVAIGAKRIETRSWSTPYRGPIAIHAAKAFPAEARRYCHLDPFHGVLTAAGYVTPDGVVGRLPRGAIVAVAQLTDCRTWDTSLQPGDRIPGRPERLTKQEWTFGNFDAGRWGWCLADVVALPEPIPCRGALGLWTVPPEIAERVAAALGHRRVRADANS